MPLRQAIAAMANGRQSYALVCQSSQPIGVLFATDVVYWLTAALDLDKTPVRQVVHTFDTLPHYPLSLAYGHSLGPIPSDGLPLVNGVGDLLAVLVAGEIYDFSLIKHQPEGIAAPPAAPAPPAHGSPPKMAAEETGAVPAWHVSDQLRLALQGARMGTWIWDLECQNLIWSAETERLFGLPPYSFNGQFETFLACIHTEDREEVHQVIKTAIQSQQPYTVSFRVLHANQESHWLALRAKVVGAEDQPQQMAGIVMDVTSQKRLEAELIRQNQQQRLMGELAQQIQQLPNIESVLARTVTGVRQLTQADRVVIVKCQATGTCQAVQEDCNPAYSSMLEWVLRDPWAVEETYLSRYREGHGLAVADIYTQRLQPEHLKYLEYFQIKAAAIVPLLSSHTLWGLIMVHQCDRPRTWDTPTIRLLQNLATQISIAIQQGKLHRKLEQANAELTRIAYLDGLTQVANRRRFDQYLMQEWRRSAREQTSLALIMGDIDFFKGFNDVYGHLAGDRCLKQVAKAIHQTLKRPGDLVARYGGEEFAVILPTTDLAGAETVAEAMRLAVYHLRLPHAKAETTDSRVTLSCGVAAMVAVPNARVQRLIEQADRALYQAKLNGRNQVAIASPH